MIAFDEIALLLEPAGPELQHWLDMYRPTRDWSAWLPPPNARHVRSDHMEFNKLVVPTGAQRWSFMVGLAANRRLREITDRLGLTTGNSPSRDYLPKVLEFG
nr:hypothetical protein [bacterium]